jgi:hypothetical protein
MRFIHFSVQSKINRRFLLQRRMRGDAFGALPFLNLDFFAATEGNLKIEVAREKYMESEKRENLTVKSQMANGTDVRYIFH